MHIAESGINSLPCGNHGARIENLEKWEKSQNHAIEKLDARIYSGFQDIQKQISSLGWGIALALLTSIINLVLSLKSKGV